MAKVTVLGARGAVGSVAVKTLVHYKRVYEPNPQHQALYDRLYGAFLDLYKHNKGIFAQLNHSG